MRNSIYATAAVFLLLLAGGCDTATGPETGHGQDGKAAVSLTIAGTEGRSVLPSNAALTDVAQWRLRGGKTDESPDWLTDLFADYANEILYLETGVWDFTLEGYKDESGSLPILRGTITGQTISLEEPNILSFEAAPLKEGEGTVRIIITLPPGHGIDRVEVLKDYGAYHPNPPLAPAGDSIVFADAFPAGDYYFSFQLYKDDDLYGVVSELVQVRQNLTSEGTYNLAREDLNLLYVITYHPNYGKPDEDKRLDYYRYTDAGVTLPIPARAGYTFGGWYANEDCAGYEVTVIPQGSAGNKDFYAAEWILVYYNISYKPDGGISYGGNPTEYTVENPLITLQDPPVRGDFSFGGWYRDDQFEEPITGPLAIPPESLEDKTFYAQWIPRYTIAFDTHGGTEVLAIKQDENTTVDEEPITTQDGFKFLGWFDAAEGETKYTWPHTLVGDVTMHAQWVRQYTITFNTHGGSEVLPVTKDVETKVSEPEDEPTRDDGYRFLGWFDAAEGGTKYTWPHTLVEDVIMHAQWKPQVSVTINTWQAPSDPFFMGETTVLSQNDSATFTIEPESGVSDIIWRWDGRVIDGETAASYTLAAYSQSPGIYELFVLVTGEDGERLSARLRVVIIAADRGGRS